MARLNEPPAQTENIDALKRRFVRQNREIARANSTQSLRIRILESETNRLLSENLSLREDVIRAETCATSEQRTRLVLDKVGSLKWRLQGKLREFGSMVEELGTLKDLEMEIGVGRGKKRAWDASAGCSGGAALAGFEGAPARVNLHRLATALPRIEEGKTYPRRSLDSQELPSLSPRDALDSTDDTHTTDSPDLGPPPIAHFEAAEAEDEGDEADEAVIYTADAAGLESTTENPSLPRDIIPTYIEGRRKRRESANVFTFRKAEDTPQEGPLIPTTQQSSPPKPTSINSAPDRSLKTGAKRKLSVRDGSGKEEEDIWAQLLLEDDGFKFTRPALVTEISINEAEKENAVRSASLSPVRGKGGVAKGAKSGSGGGKGSERARASAGKSPERRALGPKSTNHDPSSPRKQSKVPSPPRLPDLKRSFSAKDRSHGRHPSNKSASPSPTNGKPAGPNPDNHATPTAAASATLQVCEPKKRPSQQPSRRDPTPPPASTAPTPEEAAAVGLAAAGGGRPSRRPRAGVNYAEPNLRDKMRRSTKGFVDAVVGEGKLHRGGSAQPEGEGEGEGRGERHGGGGGEGESNQVRTDGERQQRASITTEVTIKKESCEDDVDVQEGCSWKQLPSAAGSTSVSSHTSGEARSSDSRDDDENRTPKADEPEDEQHIKHHSTSKSTQQEQQQHHYHHRRQPAARALDSSPPIIQPKRKAASASQAAISALVAAGASSRRSSNTRGLHQETQQQQQPCCTVETAPPPGAQHHHPPPMPASSSSPSREGIDAVVQSTSSSSPSIGQPSSPSSMASVSVSVEDEESSYAEPRKTGKSAMAPPLQTSSAAAAPAAPSRPSRRRHSAAVDASMAMAATTTTTTTVGGAGLRNRAGSGSGSGSACGGLTVSRPSAKRAHPAASGNKDMSLRSHWGTMGETTNDHAPPAVEEQGRSVVGDEPVSNGKHEAAEAQAEAEADVGPKLVRKGRTSTSTGSGTSNKAQGRGLGNSGGGGGTGTGTAGAGARERSASTRRSMML